MNAVVGALIACGSDGRPVMRDGVAWTIEHVLALAPDASSARSGRDLGVARKWVSVARSGHLIWGEGQGSGANPYRTALDLTGPAFTCSCPSRKLPCKHALGLFLLYAAEPTAVSEQTAPEWAESWLSGRRARAERAAAPAKAGAPPVDPERAAQEQRKRAERREGRVRAGVEDLERWLRDLVRAGFADVAARPRSSFEQIKARLVDAQAPGLARLVGELSDLPHAHDRWPERMLIALGRLELLLEAYGRVDRLDPDLRADVRSLVGFAASREEILSERPVRDEWNVLGRRVTADDKVRVQRTWLWGRQSARWALILDFAAGGQPFEQSLVPGTRVGAELCFYPGALPLRSLARSEPRLIGRAGEVPTRGVEEHLRAYAEGLARNPWLERFPVALGPVVPQLHEDRWWAVDPVGARLPLDSADDGWRLLAISGGVPISLVGEWDGYAVWPLAAIHQGTLVPMHAPAVAA